MRIRRPTGPGASPLPGKNEENNEQKRITIASASIGGDR
jgi:hypothetical protein